MLLLGFTPPQEKEEGSNEKQRKCHNRTTIIASSIDVEQP